MARATLILWGVAPVIAAWRERELYGHAEEDPPFKRLRFWEWPILLGGLAVVAVGWKLDVHWLTAIGAAYSALAAIRLTGRILLPRRWIRTEVDFLAITSVDTLMRVALWGGLLASLLVGHWTLAAVIGSLLAGAFLIGVAFSVVVHRILGRRESSVKVP